MANITVGADVNSLLISNGVVANSKTALTALGAVTTGDSVLPTPNLRGLNNTINSIQELGDGPISIINIGDSFASGFVGYSNGAKVVGSYRCGSANTGGGESGVSQISNDYTRSPDSKYIRVASGGTLSCAHLQTGNPGPVTHIYYTLFTGVGTAQFSFSINGGSTWTNVGSAINTATITDVLVGSIPISQYNSAVICRMQVTVGNVDGWMGQGCDGTGVTQIGFATTGQGIEQSADINPAIWKKMIAGWRAVSIPFAPTGIVKYNYYTITTVGTTNFVTNFGASANTVGTVFRATATGSAGDTTTGRVSQSESQIILSVFADHRFTTVATTNYPTVGIAGWASSGPANDLYVNSRALDANPSCDWFVVGPHSVDPARVDTANATIDAAFAAIGINTLNTQVRNVDGAKAQREFAERIGAGFVDCIPMFPNYTLAVAEGNYTDDIHLNNRGQLAKRAYAYNNSNLGWVLGSEAYRSSIRLGDARLNANTNRGGVSTISVSTINGINLAPIVASDLRAGRSDKQETEGVAMWAPSLNNGNIGFFTTSNGRDAKLVFDPNAFTPFSAGLITCGDVTRPWGMVNTNGLRVGFVKKTADYTIPRTVAGAQDYMIACDGTFTTTLPLARDVESSGQAGKVYVIKNIGIGVVTVAAVSTNAIAATAMVNGTTYVIEFTGTTVFTSFGAPSNNVGTSFVATGAGTGTGTLRNTLQKIDNVTTKTLAAGDTLRVISAQTSGFTSADWGNWLTW